jgi:photosystem II stability/assembly factor-like uncharacterized protein
MRRAIVLVLFLAFVPGSSAGVAARFDPRDIAFWTLNDGMVAGFELRADRGWGRARVDVTHDGGRSWRPVWTGRLARAEPVIAAVRGGRDGWIALPSGVLRSSDRGRTWSKISARPNLLRLSFANARVGWALSAPRSEERPWFLLMTVDGGITWRNRPIPPCSITGLISLVSPVKGWLACGGLPGAGNQEKRVFSTIDGGRTWRLRSGVMIDGSQVGNLSPGGYLATLSFLPNGHGWLGVRRGYFVSTNDGGAHWSVLPVSRPESVEAYAVSLLTDRQGLALFQYVRTLRVTRDGGRTWRVVHRFF